MPEITNPQEIQRIQGLAPIGEPAGAAKSALRKVWEYPTTETEPPNSFFEFFSRVIPESAAKTAIGTVRFPVDVAQAIASPERGEKLLEIGKGAMRFFGEPIGAFGLEEMKKRWSTDPVGAAFALSPFAKYGLKRAGVKPVMSQGKALALEPWNPRSNIEAQYRVIPREPSRVQKILNWYLEPPPLKTPFREALKDWQDAKQKISFDLEKATKEHTKVLKDASGRDAMRYFIEAGGDTAKISGWMQNAKPELQKAYLRAMNLTPEEMNWVQQRNVHMRDLGETAVRNGMMRDLLDNYVTHLYEKGERQGIIQRIIGAFENPKDFGSFSTKPWMLHHRIIETYHQSERLGYKAKIKDIVALDALYEQSLLQAQNNRALIKRLSGSISPDDARPILAVEGKRVGRSDEGGVPEAVLIKPHARAHEVGDYVPLNHPSFRKWKWVAEVERDPLFVPDPQGAIPGGLTKVDLPGTQLFMQGDMVVHPDYAKAMKNLLLPSAIRMSPTGRAALAGVLGMKQLLLSFSGFHQVQVGIHGVFHWVDPTHALPKIDFSNPDQALLIKSGQVVSDFTARELHHEGLAATDLIRKIPGIGPILHRYTDYLFSDYIPRLKMKMGLAALRRNRERYSGKLTEDQIGELTARQANAAFGEQNYTLMDAIPRNKTFQDIMRLFLLAPDFLEARARFVGQAGKPYGTEQAAALLRGALLMYVPARIINQIMDGDPHFEKPFSVVLPIEGEKREFTVRSVPGDILHLLADPRGFIYYRLSSASRAGLESLTGRNMYGQKVLKEDQAKDILRNVIPIPFQGPSRKFIGPRGPEYPWWESLMRSMGLSSWPFRSMAEQEALKLFSDRLPKGALKGSERDMRASRRELIDALRTRGKVPEKFQAAVKSGAVKFQDIDKVFKEAGMSNLESIFRHLNLDEAIHVMKYATKEEKGVLRSILFDKINRAVARGQMSEELNDWLGGLSL